MEGSFGGTFIKSEQQQHEQHNNIKTEPQQQTNDFDMSTLQGRLSETRLSDASLFDETFFDSVMRESLDGNGVGQGRESFDGMVKIEGMGTRSSVDGNYGRGSLDCGYRGSLDMRGSLDIRSSDLTGMRGSIDQGYMGPGFEASIMREIGNIDESPTTIVGGSFMMPPPMAPYSCAQNPMLSTKMNKDGPQLSMLHQQQQPPPNYMGGVFSQSQFMINPNPLPPQQPMPHFMAMPQPQGMAFPQTMKNILGGILKKPTPKPEPDVKRPAKKKASDTHKKTPSNSNAAASSQAMSHDCSTSGTAASNGPVSTNKTSSYRGVSKASTNSWGAKFSGKRIKSTCKSEQEAAEVYDDFLRKHRPDLFVKLANFCPQCGADRVRGPQCICFNDISSIC